MHYGRSAGGFGFAVILTAFALLSLYAAFQ